LIKSQRQSLHPTFHTHIRHIFGENERFWGLDNQQQAHRISSIANAPLFAAVRARDFHQLPMMSSNGPAGTEQPVDTSTAAGKAFFDMLGVFAEFETNLRRERQAEGIKAAKRKGVYRGRPPKIDMATIQAKLGAGLSPTEIAREMGISRGSVYKAKAQMPPGVGAPEGIGT
jgi:hypothetical protein